MSEIIDAFKNVEITINLAKQKCVDLEILNDQYKEANKKLKAENKKLKDAIVKHVEKHDLYYSDIHKGKQVWFSARYLNELGKTLAKIKGEQK